MEKLLGRRISVVRYVGVLVACVASVSARVRRENWDESIKRGMKGEGREGNATLARVLVIWVFVISRFHCFIVTVRLSLRPSPHYFAPPRKSNRGTGLPSHNYGWGGVISRTERSCAAPILKVERHISGRFYV